MGLFNWLFGERPKEPPARDYEGTFQMLNGYTPTFTTWQGGVYESELVRSAINALAVHISKLKVEMMGTAHPVLQNKLKHAPNSFQTWSQFMERAATIYFAQNNLIITPVFGEFGEITGVYTPMPTRCEVVQYNDEPWLRYVFANGNTAAVELRLCAIIPRMQYKNDFFGETNGALEPTMNLIGIQNQGIEEGVKSAATYRFMAQMTNFTKPADLKKERKRFTKMNLAADAEGGGLLLFPNNMTNIQQITAKPFVVDAEQMAQIRANVYEYFGVNEEILTNHFTSETWSAFYEGAIEPFAIKFSEAMTKMLFTLREQSSGNMVMATANRLQYMSNSDKLNVSAQLLDRGIISINDAREIWNLPPIEDGDLRIIRGEYYNADDKVATEEPDPEEEPEEEPAEDPAEEQTEEETEEDAGGQEDEDGEEGNQSV